jgi:hypothetical protein
MNINAAGFVKVFVLTPALAAHVTTKQKALHRCDCFATDQLPPAADRGIVPGTPDVSQPCNTGRVTGST